MNFGVDKFKKVHILLGRINSIGVAMMLDGEARPASVLLRADQAMYEAKRIGRNRWVCQ
jgi:GGDEF domain-containing protein